MKRGDRGAAPAHRARSAGAHLLAGKRYFAPRWRLPRRPRIHRERANETRDDVTQRKRADGPEFAYIVSVLREPLYEYEIRFDDGPESVDCDDTAITQRMHRAALPAPVRAFGPAVPEELLRIHARATERTVIIPRPRRRVPRLVWVALGACLVFGTCVPIARALPWIARVHAATVSPLTRAP